MPDTKTREITINVHDYMLIPTDTDQDKANAQPEAPREDQSKGMKVYAFLNRKQTLAFVNDLTEMTHVMVSEDDGSNCIGFDERGNLMLNGGYLHIDHPDGTSMASYAPDACSKCGKFHPSISCVRAAMERKHVEEMRELGERQREERATILGLENPGPHGTAKS